MACLTSITESVIYATCKGVISGINTVEETILRMAGKRVWYVNVFVFKGHLKTILVLVIRYVLYTNKTFFQLIHKTGKFILGFLK